MMSGDNARCLHNLTAEKPHHAQRNSKKKYSGCENQPYLHFIWLCAIFTTAAVAGLSLQGCVWAPGDSCVRPAVLETCMCPWTAVADSTQVLVKPLQVHLSNQRSFNST
jgi:hypothetical protein